MIYKFLSSKIKNNFSYPPTTEQDLLINALSEFIVSGKETIFLLKGYAGTGKTTVISSLVKTLDELKQPVMLMAPTGRAAKVLSAYSGKPAYTIHKKIYRQRTGGELYGIFNLNVNLSKHTLFIVDEASMINNQGMESNFGSGKLLDDLIEYVYGGDGCRLILIGDTAQLPPVGQTVSPALDKNILEMYGFEVNEFSLSQVMRQAEESGILFNASQLRELLRENSIGSFPKINVDFPDIHKITGEELIETLSSSYQKDGTEETIVITRSNKSANLYNNGIRNRILYREEEISSGDMLMIVKNNYFWTKSNEKLDFIANGDIAEIIKIRKKQEMYGFRFAEVTLFFPDYDLELDTKIILDTLQSASPSLSYEENNRLFMEVQEDYADITNKRNRILKMREDPYLNALQVKFAYAVTAHKAQGGQWANVFIDQGYIVPEMINNEYLRWLYTAFTRATHNLYLVNWKT
jgi:exodeoxyribonuclease-5